jgi:hypothetical protein
MTGRILKIKTGYNPNSSSIGIDMIAFFTAGAAVTVLFNTMAAVLASAKPLKHAQPEEVKEASEIGQLDPQGRVS